MDAKNNKERRLLWTVLGLNATMFVVEFAAGWLASSSALLADSLDMLADTLVYSLSLYAVGKGDSLKAKSALLNGSLQMTLGLLVLAEVARRAWFGSAPSAELMSSVGLLALVVNAICFFLLFRFRSGDVNMRASWVCSRNDMAANIGVLAAAGLVALLGSPWPDLMIGVLIATLVIHSAWGIIRDAKQRLDGRGCGSRMQ